MRLLETTMVAVLALVASCKNTSETIQPPASSATPKGAWAAAFSLRSMSRNGIVAVHHPPDFAVTHVRDDVVRLERTAQDGTLDMLTVVALEGPFSMTVEEFTRIVEPSDAPGLPGWVPTHRKPATCSGQPGLEIVGTWKTEGGKSYRRRACAFLWSGRGLLVSFSLPQTAEPSREARLREMAEAVEIVRRFGHDQLSVR